ncbi:hypothetical protein L1049_022045 [Liquidambar formosana]|uniref:Uncharacterized protein n=1 Tax=Liquidambar formosana TaxID=63359 RepID=A0AAP0WQF4_LIQFO
MVGGDDVDTVEGIARNLRKLGNLAVEANSELNGVDFTPDIEAEGTVIVDGVGSIFRNRQKGSVVDLENAKNPDEQPYMDTGGANQGRGNVGFESEMAGREVRNSNLLPVGPHVMIGGQNQVNGMDSNNPKEGDCAAKLVEESIGTMDWSSPQGNLNVDIGVSGKHGEKGWKRRARE